MMQGSSNLTLRLPVKRDRGEESMVGMGYKAGTGKTEHELLVDIQFNIGDFPGQLLGKAAHESRIHSPEVHKMFSGHFAPDYPLLWGGHHIIGSKQVAHWALR